MAIAEQVVESCYAGHEFRGIFGQVDIGTMLSETGQKLGRGGIEGYGRAKDPKSALTVVIDIVYRAEGWHFLLQSGAVQRILMNIVGNALKYTPAGWVRVHVSFEEKDCKTTVHIIVSDSGKGISPEFLKNRLFSPFAQEDTLQVGTGLGMSIVKQVVERLGGSINVNSQVNVGTQVHISLPAESVPRPAGVDSCVRLRSLTKGMKVFLAGFDNRVPASRLLFESIANYLTHWYDIRVVEDVNSSDLIISDECPELLDYFQQTSPSDRSPFAFGQSSVHSGTPFPTPDSAGSHSVYRAWQPLIVLCSNALRYEFFGQQAEEGKIMDFSSKPIGPYKLARSILFCIEQAETRRRSLEVSSPIKPVEEGVFEEHVGVPGGRQGSMGRGVVRFSPTVRRGSADHSASMYLPGKGLVPAPTSSIVEPQKFVGMRRKTHAKGSLSGSSIPAEDERENEIKHTISQTQQPSQVLIPAELPPTPSPETVTPPTRKTAAFAKPEVYNRQNPPRSVALTQPSQKAEFTDINIPPTPAVLDTIPSRKPCVLIVEDNAVNALILATFLRKRNFPFVKAENGLLAVQAVQSRPEGFDVILMDIQMPVMDGSAATAAIRAIERDRGTAPTSYIIALTGLAADKDRQVAFDSGVDHFLTKPVSLKQLGVVIDDWKTRDVVRGGLKSDFLQHKITVV
jgi:CheY-like chemotaxis protein/anti-sigma regulatory factor (Ser/Thr protein kinase)